MRCPDCNHDMVCTEETHHYTESALDYIYLENMEKWKCECRLENNIFNATGSKTVAETEKGATELTVTP